MDELVANFELSEGQEFDALFEIYASGTTWGNIDGDISNQIDLKEALDSKASNERVDNIVASIDDDIEEINTNISDLQTTVSDNYSILDNKIDSVESDLQGDIDTLENAVNTNTSNISTLNTTVSNLNTTVQSNYTILDTKINTTQTTLQGNIDTLSGTVTSNYNDLTQSITNNVSTLNTRITNEVSTLNGAIYDEATARANADNNLQSQIDAITSASDVFDIVGTYAELQAYDISTVPVNDIIKVLVDSTHNNAATYYRCTETGNVKSWTYIGSEGAYYTKSEADGLFVEQTTTINGKPLSSNITLTPTDIGALPSSTQIGNGTITLTQGGNQKGTFTLNQTGNATIDFDAAGSTITVDSVLSTSSTNPVQNKVITTELNKKMENITSNDVISALGYTPYNSTNPNGFTSNVGTVTSVNNIQPDGNGNVTVPASIPTNMVTTNTDQNISGIKTFIGAKRINFKQSTVDDKLGFTLYNPSSAELAAFEYRPNTVNGNALLNINTNSTNACYIGFRYWISHSPGVNIIAPKVPVAGDYYIPINFTNGTNTVTSNNSGTVNISSIIPTVNNATLTIQKNGSTVNTFTANASNNVTANITVPTATSDLINDSGYITNSAIGNGTLSITQNGSTLGTVTMNQSGNTTIDIPPSSSRNIGEIVASTLPLTDAGLHLLDGALIDGNGIYSDFVDYISNLDLTANYFCTEAEWQQSVTDYGVCGKFVYDSSNNTVRLPKITGIIEGTTDVTALGDLVEAGLPNITGTMTASGWKLGRPALTGAFYREDTGGDRPSYGSSGGSDWYFDASRSNPIYGNSTTVQPQTIKAFYYIVIATTTKTNIQVDIDEIATDLNGKADVDLTNTTPTSNFATTLNTAGIRTVVETYLNGKSWYRVYSDGWIEQGGYSTTWNSKTSFIKNFSDTNYTILLIPYGTHNCYENACISSVSVDGFTGYEKVDRASGFYWVAYGY